LYQLDEVLMRNGVLDPHNVQLEHDEQEEWQDKDDIWDRFLAWKVFEDHNDFLDVILAFLLYSVYLPSVFILV
jgi:hypothetical protein